MSIDGVRQLTTLIIRYCEFGGSSKGIRMFLHNGLAQFQQENPDLKVKIEKVNGKHPILRGDYSMLQTNNILIPF